MKYVIFSLAEAGKLEFAGIEKLGKNDHVVCIHVKGKKTISAALKKTFETVKATIDYVEIGATSELWIQTAYLMGYHVGAKHDVILVTKDKSKLPSKVTKDAKVYTSFKSVGNAASSSTSNKKDKDKDDVTGILNSFTSGNAADGLMQLAQQFLK